MLGRHHQFNGHELGQTLGDTEGQGSLVWGSPWGHKESDMTWRLNNNLNRHFFKEDTQIANKFMKSSSTSVIIKENQNTVRYHFTPIRMATIKNKQRGTAAAAAARAAARALAATSYAHRIVSNTQSVKRLFTFHTSSDSRPVFLDRECWLLKRGFL